jgi:predicted N-acetyltransferase YhbS
MTLQIAYLADHSEDIPFLAAWHYAQWGYLYPNESIDWFIHALRTHLSPQQIPTTFVALQDQALIGSASLIVHDMDTRPHLYPWLASVYVVPHYRNQGIGSTLVRRVEEEARTLGVQTLYLYTPDRQRFYERLGWQVLERCEYRGYLQVVMSRALQSAPAPRRTDTR